MGILPTGVAQLLLTQVIRDAGPVFMSLVNYQVPLWSVVLGALILAEPLPPSLLMGMALILGGVGAEPAGGVAAAVRAAGEELQLCTLCTRIVATSGAGPGPARAVGITIR